MIDHVGIYASDVEVSKKFYEAAFAPLSYNISFGKDGVFHAFAVGSGLFEIMQSEDTEIVTTSHVAFRVTDKSLVDAFFDAAIAADGTDNGAPGPRPEYTPNYYAAFILDPDGHNIEVMCDE